MIDPLVFLFFVVFFMEQFHISLSLESCFRLGRNLNIMAIVMFNNRYNVLEQFFCMDYMRTIHGE